MNLNVLQTFVEVARQGSFAAAARAVDTDPSLISRAVAGLEKELGVRLFHRSTRQMALTEAGALYLARAEAVVEELAHARDEARAVSAEPQGTLRLTTSVAFGQACLMPLMPAFRSRFPDVRLELILTDQNLDLVGERIDLAIRLAPSIESDMICAKLFATRYRVCASPAYLAKAPQLTKPVDIGEHDALLFSLPAFRSRWLFRDAAGAVTEAPVRGGMVLSNALALRDAMLAGLGPALLANWLVDEDIAAGRCVDLFPDYAVAATTFDTAAWLVYPSRRFLPEKVRVALDFLRERLGT